MKVRTEIDIIIPTYNGSKHIQGILRSIREQTFKNYRCIVIDDCSNDNTVKIVKNKFPWVTLIAQNKNQGPAKNRNIAIKHGESPYIAIFDDDTFLDDIYWLETALNRMKDNPFIGQIASTIISGYDKNLVLDCGIFRDRYLFGGRFFKYRLNRLPKADKISKRILGACTAGTMIRRDVFEKVGGFDEHYFYLVEDVELSMRIHLAGYDVVFEPNLRTYHLESQAMGKDTERKLYLLRRNSMMAIGENMPFLLTIKVVPFIILREIILRSIFHFLLAKLRNRKFEAPQETKDYINILNYFRKNFSRIKKKRKQFNNVRVRPRRYLLKM